MCVCVSMISQLNNFVSKNKIIILLVDDSIVFQKLMFRVLKKKGFEVFTVNDGEDALNIIQCIIFDLIISDIHMPNMDGIEFVRKARNNYNVKTPIVLYSTDWTLEKQALEAGANIFIDKNKNCIDIERCLSNLIDKFCVSDDRLGNVETRENKFTIVKNESRSFGNSVFSFFQRIKQKLIYF